MAISYEKQANNIVILTMDAPGRSVNLIDDTFGAILEQAVERLATEQPLAGVILASAKSTFIAGADLQMIWRLEDASATMQLAEALKHTLRRLETLGVPVVAAINGTALGGGLEVALACHHRIAVDDPRIRLSLPEVTLGLLPGGGGVTRVTRMLGLQKAFSLLTEGKRFDPRAAQAVGIIDELASDGAEMMAQAQAWILAHPQSAQAWDQAGFRIPGGGPHHPRNAGMVAIAPAMVRQKTFGNYPAPAAILSALIEGAAVDFDTASRIESRYFAAVATGKVAKNMLHAFWFQLNEIKDGRSRPKGVSPRTTHKVGVLGAGLMGHGIAYASALAGVAVVLKDVNMDLATAGKARIEKLLAGRVQRRRLSPEQKQAALDHILVTDSAADLADCDLIIEAVPENRQIKEAVLREADAHLDPDAVICSNTSTLPITSLAAYTSRPHNFIGLHFFSPVPKMQLVEIIRGQQTSASTLAKAFDFVLQIRKTPIVVNDSRGFYTSRVFTAFVYEGLAMLTEGQYPHTIEMAGMQAGMPMGPLAVSDEVNLGLAMHILDQTRQDLAAEGKALPYHPGYTVLEKMVHEYQRLGKAQGAGFYDYPSAAPKHLWPQLQQIFPTRAQQLSQQEMIDRMMFIQALETVRCFEEGVVSSVAEANIGSIFGWGFAAFKGGTLQYINDYGLPAFVERSKELAALYGERFAVPALLQRIAAAGQQF
ncbi:MAG: 3-hydroxyacyl-CoA dehydrogenase [Chloroflexi bacterium]|nr:3-hydroxyacyl-CoA dehydrogenase [Chloroflexota bacterium]